MTPTGKEHLELPAPEVANILVVLMLVGKRHLELPVPEVANILVVLMLVGKRHLEFPLPEAANILAPVVRVLAHIGVVDSRIVMVDLEMVGSSRSRIDSFLNRGRYKIKGF